MTLKIILDSMLDKFAEFLHRLAMIWSPPKVYAASPLPSIFLGMDGGLSPFGRLCIRMGRNPNEGQVIYGIATFNKVTICSVVDCGDTFAVLIKTNSEAMLLHDPAPLFPTDNLIIKLKMLAGE